jgi:ParB/Sulfiredoxin domain
MSATRKRALRIDDPIAAVFEPSSAVSNPASADPGGAVKQSRLRELSVNEIHPNPDQPRKRFDEEALTALADSIRERGVLQPIIVRPDPAGGYELVAGERRWRAAELAGEPTIPALIDDQLDGAGSLELALIENVVREDLTPIEEASPGQSPYYSRTSGSPRPCSPNDSAEAAPTSRTPSAYSTSPTKPSN